MALEKQMELFEEGGLMQEGGTVDEESGNDVPVGSLKKEVRDDIPAQLSEGEFVMPADVVRFHGLDKMMALRDEAKMGLQRMEDMGQMGNADEATIPDGVPFSMDDLEIEDEPVEMQQGGFIRLPSPPMPNPPFPFPIPQPEYGTTFTPAGTRGSSFGQREPQYNQYQVPTYGGYQPPQPQAVPTAPTGLPSFSDFVTPKYELYVNDAGSVISIPVDANGNPLIPVPAGYKKQSDTTATTPTIPDTGVTPVAATTAAPTQREEDPSDGREFGGGPAGLTMNQAKRAVLEQLDPAFASKIKGIKAKYDTPFNIIGEFKEGSEIRKALSEYNYDDLIAKSGLTREELDDVIGDLTQEVFTGYRDPVTGEVSGQKKPPRSFSEQLSSLFGGEVEPSGDGDDLGSAPTGTSTAFRLQEDDPGESGLDSVTVETTQTLAEEGSTAADAARNKIFELRDFQKNLGLSENQSLDMLVALTQGDTGVITFPTANNPEGQRLDFSQFSDESRVAAKTLVDEMLNEGVPEVKNKVAAAITRYNVESASRDAEDRSAAEAARLQADIKRAEERRAALEAIQAAEREERRRAAEAARLQAEAEEAARKAEQARILEEQRRRQQSQRNTSDDDDDGPNVGGSGVSQSVRDAIADAGGYTGGGRYGGFAEGGLASKPKPKAKKKMKQGGLASKK